MTDQQPIRGKASAGAAAKRAATRAAKPVNKGRPTKSRPARRSGAASAERAKHQRAAAMLRELRSDAENLLANAKQLLSRLS
jgi:hypothetical protein